VKPSSLIEDELIQFELELARFNQSDALVHLNIKEVHPFIEQEESLTPQINLMLKEAARKDREEGIFPLCLSEGLLTLMKEEKKQCIPIFIHLLQATTNPILSTVVWNIHEEDWMINPYLIHLFSFEEKTLSSLTKEELVSTLREKGYGVEPAPRYIGNFHPYRHALLKEVIELKKKKEYTPFEFLFDGDQKVPEESSAELYPTLLPCDQSQFDAIRLAEQFPTVIQGPPGTGKSQVITNLIGRFLLRDQYLLVCSQKRQALEVVAEKLSVCGLGDLVLMKSSSDSVKSILSALKQSWNILDQPRITGELNAHNFLKQHWVQSQLNTYHKPGLIGSLSPKAFLEETGYTPAKKSSFHAGLPTFEQWVKIKPLLADIPFERIKALSVLNPGLTLQKSYESYCLRWRSVYNALKDMGWETLNMAALMEKQNQSQWVHLFSNELAKRCLPWMKHRKRIDRLIPLLQATEETLKNDSKALMAWKMVPTPLEIEGLLGLFKESSWKRPFSLRSAKKRWLRDSVTDFFQLIVETKSYFERTEQREEILQKLISLGLSDPTTDISTYRTFSLLYDGDLHVAFEQIPIKERIFFQQNHTQIQKIILELKHFFTLEPSAIVYEKIGYFLAFDPFIPFLSAWEKIPGVVRNALGSFHSIHDMEKAIITSDWQRFTAYFPSIDEFIFSSQGSILKEIVDSNQGNQGQMAERLLIQRKERFDAYHTLLSTPNGQLNASDKTLKKRLQNGKRTLAKLFSRQRNFPSLKNLLDGDAMLWIRVLKPIWFSSPENLAMDIPLVAGWFNVSIIDEASQLLLSHSLGTIYRSSHVIVAGDEMQMAPSSFFKAGNHLGTTLLDQASFNLPKHRLTFHYRSQQKDLIQFSNEHFYQNKLTVLPTYPKEKSIYSYPVVEGIYEDGSNIEEAKLTCKLLLERIGIINNRVGLVAFSEKQLRAINALFTPSERQKIEMAQAKGQLFLKTVEQIQGDECDEIIISFCYGKKQNGMFDMRFGPVNQEGGDKRLNVLFSRAKKRLYFIHSVKSEDFPVSENLGVHTLRKWFNYLEASESKEESMALPISSFAKAEGNTIQISRWIDVSANLLDIITFKTVLAERGWIIEEAAFSVERDRTRVLPLDGNVKSA
jgi:hypothetical protein